METGKPITPKPDRNFGDLDAPIKPQKFFVPKDIVKTSRKITSAGMWAIAMRLSQMSHTVMQKKEEEEERIIPMILTTKK